MKKLIFLILLSIASASYAGAFKSGNELYEYLKSKDTDTSKYILGMGYILGVMDSRFDKCNLDSGVQGIQIFDTVSMYLANHPEMRQYSGSSIVEIAVKEKFKCK